MPHKVNPIDFENAEGNLGIANALFEHFSRKLPVSRLQRDLSDSTVLRAIGTAFAHAVIGYASLVKGFGKISVNAQAMREALAENPEVLAEAIQTVLRKEGIDASYERLMELDARQEGHAEDFAAFIDTLAVNADVKKRLKALTPDSYIGLASEIAKGLFGCRHTPSPRRRATLTQRQACARSRARSRGCTARPRARRPTSRR